MRVVSSLHLQIIAALQEVTVPVLIVWFWLSYANVANDGFPRKLINHLMYFCKQLTANLCLSINTDSLLALYMHN